MADPANPRKSDRTRAAILAAAAELFAQRGYAGATVRAVAEGAGVDPALVVRYFGSKDALFARVARVDLRLPKFDPAQRAEAGDALIRRFVALWEGGEPGDQSLAILLRSAVTNEEVAAKIRAVFAAQVAPALASFGDPATAAIRAGLVVSQLFGLALCRYILRLPPVADMSREDLVARLGPIIQMHLDGA